MVKEPIPKFINHLLDVDITSATGSDILAYDDSGNVVNKSKSELDIGSGSDLTTHTSDTNNPHLVNKNDVVLGNVDNTSDTDKPVSTAQQTALDGKVDDFQVLTNVPSGALFTDTVYDDTAIQSSVALNTLKVTNATHTGQVTGDGALTVDKTVISDQSTVTADGTDYVMIADTSDSGNLKKVLISDFASAGGDMAAATYDPTSVAGDAFDMDNMVEGTTSKILTSTEKTILGNTSGTNSGDNSVNTTYANDYRLSNFVSGTDYEPAKGSDDNFVTDDEKTVISNTSGTNSGDQVSSDFTHDDLSGVHQDVTITSNPVFLIPTVNALQIDTSASEAWSVGQISWEDNFSVAKLGLDETGVSAPIVENTFKVQNESGQIITRLTAVYPTGATGNNSTVDLADSSDFGKISSVGIIRSASINNNAVGYVTTFGRMANSDTSAWSEGDILYVSASTPGDLTNVKPAYPNYPLRVGVVARSHATEGSIIIDINIVHDIDQDLSIGSSPTLDGTNITGIDASLINITDTYDKFVQTTVDTAIDEIGETKNWTGYDRQDPDSMPDLSWDNGTRTVSVSVKSGQSSFHFWVGGKKITKTTTQSVAVPDTSGSYYAYFDLSGVLQYVEFSVTPNDAFYQFAITAMIRWNATQGSGGVGSELHGIRMSAATHKYNHDTFGARYASGMDIEGLEDGEPDYTQTTSGCFWDEDIEHCPITTSTHPFMYRLGATGEWTTTPLDNYIAVKEDSGDTYYSWNEWTGSTWQLTQGGSSTDYWITFFVATPAIDNTKVIKKIVGQNAYANRTDARNAIEAEVHSLKMDGLPSPEIVFLYAVIARRNGDLEDLGNGDLIYDLRVVKGGASGGSSSATNASDIPTDITNFNNHLSNADTNVQLALDTLDDHDHTVSQISDLTATSTEINYTDGVTSSIQDQLDNKLSTTRTFTAGESLVSGDLCYYKSDSKMWKADNDVEATIKGMLTICTETISADANGTFLIEGEYTTTGLTSADEQYVSSTAGEWTSTKPTTSGDLLRVIGFALSTTILYFKPDNMYIEVE